MERKFVLSCCSTVDLPYAYMAQRDIPVLFYHYVVGDQEYVDDMGRDPAALPRFYGFLKAGQLPQTSQINVADYLDFFVLNLYMCVILIDYIWKFERATAQFIQKATMSPYIPRPNQHLVNIRRACMSIAGDHVLPSSDNIRLAIKILAMNIDKMVKVEFN